MDINVFFNRYKPYMAIVAAVIVLLAFMPGDADDQVSSGAPQQGAGLPLAGQSAVGQPVTDASGAPVLDATGAVVTTPASGGGGGGAAAPVGGARAPVAGGGGGGGQTQGATPTPAAAAPTPSASAAANTECDQATGRIKVPSKAAFPCVPAHSGSNGGTTYMGVTADTVKVVLFRPESNPAVDAALTAAGANNTREEALATFLGYIELFNAHSETYGRTVEIVVRDGSGPADDDAVGRADALAIATEDKPFAVIGSSTSSFVEELAARGILCICGASLPQDTYERLNPYFGYTTLMASTQGYVHRAEYVGKRLAFRLAKHAGPNGAVPMNTGERVFGLLYYDTPDGAYKSGVDFFQKELAEKYGVTLKEVLAYPSDLAESAEASRPLIQRLKNSNVTSVIFSGDFINPATYTREATNQQYFPEWIITGSVLTDTTIFARTYDPNQWNRAFGVSFLTLRMPDEFNNAYRLWEWHYGNGDIPADNQFKVIYPSPAVLFTGIHLAGPNLTVANWQAGLFSMPLTGAGGVTAPAFSYGNHGIWPFTDFTAYDDVTEIWWDPTVPGEDEVGNDGVGMYRYVDNGRRYLPGQHPSTEPVVFTSPETAPAFIQEPPAHETPPDYEHKAHG